MEYGASVAPIENYRDKGKGGEIWNKAWQEDVFANSPHKDLQSLTASPPLPLGATGILLANEVKG